jgi:hypothetical protein
MQIRAYRRARRAEHNPRSPTSRCSLYCMGICDALDLQQVHMQRTCRPIPGATDPTFSSERYVSVIFLAWHVDLTKPAGMNDEKQ